MRRRVYQTRNFESYDTPGQCGKCGYKVELASGINHRLPPKPGDLTLCLKCGALHRFNAELALELTDMPSDADRETRYVIAKAQKLIKENRERYS